MKMHVTLVGPHNSLFMPQGAFTITIPLTDAELPWNDSFFKHESLESSSLF